MSKIFYRKRGSNLPSLEEKIEKNQNSNSTSPPRLPLQASLTSPSSSSSSPKDPKIESFKNNSIGLEESDEMV